MNYSLFFVVLAALNAPLASLAMAAAQPDSPPPTLEPSASSEPSRGEPAAAEPAAGEPVTAEPVTAADPLGEAEPRDATERAEVERAGAERAGAEPSPSSSQAPPSAGMPAAPDQPAPDQPAPEQPAADPREPREPGFVFNFSGAGWKDVLEWFVEQADLSLQVDRFPAGTVNYSDPTRVYDAAESLDILNRLLLDRGYALVRRGRMLLLIDLEVENAANLISEVAELVSVDELDDRSRSDIVSSVFPLGSLTPDAARTEIAQLIGPWGRVVVLDSARQVKVTETVSKLLAIRQLLENARQADSTVVEIVLQHRGSEEVLEIARPLIGLDPGQNANDEIRLSMGLYGERIYATGLPGKVALLESIVQKADKPLDTADPNTSTEVVVPVFETHAVQTADPATVFDVLQTLLAGTPETRIAVDPKTNAIVAYARPETQAMIAATIAKLEGSGQDFKVLTLRRLDPAQALLTINKFFGVTAESTGGPIVDGDPVTRRLWIRGKPEQIAIIEELITELEGEDVLGNMSDQVRVLPYSGQAAQDALRQVQSVWSTLGRTNEIRTIRTAGSSASSGNEMPERRVHPAPPRDNANVPPRERPTEQNQTPEAVPSSAVENRTEVRRPARQKANDDGAGFDAGYQLVAAPLQETEATADPDATAADGSGSALAAVSLRGAATRLFPAAHPPPTTIALCRARSPPKERIYTA
ncbi:MAG: secretin N-terminal domain-containing protein, partial [Novipirellula sp. JB048]